MIGGLFALLLVPFLVGLGLIVKQKQGTIPFAFALGTLFVYTWFTPALLWWLGVDAIADLPYGTQRPEMLGVYLLGVGVFVGGWWVLPPFQFRIKQVGALQKPPLWALLVGILVLWCGIMYGISQVGVPLNEWYTCKNSNKYLDLFGKHWPTPLVDKLSDMLISLGYMLWVWYPPLGSVIGLVLLVLFGLEGFRYRHLLLVGGLFVRLFWVTPSGPRRLALWGLVALGCVGMAWLTLNRIRFSQRLFKKMDHNLAHFDLRLLANETNNSQTFGVVLGYYHAQSLKPDGVLATPTFVGVRAVPAFLFPENKKPLPPLLGHIKEAYSATPAGVELHPAVSNLEEYYLGYGAWGVIAGMLFLAGLCRWMASWGPMGGSLGTVFLFQLISRGYLPQQVDLAFFLVLPWGLLYLWQWLGRRQSPNPAPVE